MTPEKIHLTLTPEEFDAIYKAMMHYYYKVGFKKRQEKLVFDSILDKLEEIEVKYNI